MSYLSLFISAFVAATLLPFYSEVILGVMLVNGANPLWLWLSATCGNTLGSWVNWLLGRYLLHFQHKKWFPFKPESLNKAQNSFKKYGLWSLLFAWLPIIGDPITFVAGIMKVRVLPFLVLVFIGKGARYGIVIALASQVN
ncbi:YqaA family protein [Alkalimarinus alittae]|uniref:DedA family protein n=1 Tax=Alkalimarinus alittae TaxID=2961619 RepID=A0ABY6N7F2_9ALTE|nr:YqaA family protein [Alkalimarinus alittae]UZE98068.1 DedA family protein [Alkalimarinus alittae]